MPSNGSESLKKVGELDHNPSLTVSTFSLNLRLRRACDDEVFKGYVEGAFIVSQRPNSIAHQHKPMQTTTAWRNLSANIQTIEPGKPSARRASKLPDEVFQMVWFRPPGHIPVLSGNVRFPVVYCEDIGNAARLQRIDQRIDSLAVKMDVEHGCIDPVQHDEKGQSATHGTDWTENVCPRLL
jgi:hypothetical protein